MKYAKKLVGFLLCLVMVFVMSTTAFAATITINPGTPDSAETSSTTAPTYTYYQMMKASVGSGNTVSYYVETEVLADALCDLTVGSDDLFTVTRVGTTNHWNVVINKKSDDTAFTGEEVAAALATIKNDAIVTGTASNNQISISGDGYVLIESSLGTKLVVDTYTTKEVNEKNTYPSNTKTEDKQNAEIGEAVTYTVTVVIPANVASKAITIYDTISDGLTLNTAATVAGAVANPAYTSATWTQNMNYSATDNEKQYTIMIPAETVLANAGKTLTFTYTATVNENAVVNADESNKAHIAYDNFVSKDIEVKVKTFGFELVKTDSSSPATPLAGVKFTLTNAAGEYYTPGTNDTSVDKDRFPSSKTKVEVATDNQGKISFTGLKAGTYTLTETQTLSGYILLSGPITVTIDNNGTASFSGQGASGTGNTVTIVNNPGSLLPSTGGMGTTVFYVAGSILLIVAVVLLITRKRMSNKR